jgi:hypothetical protein
VKVDDILLDYNIFLKIKWVDLKKVHPTLYLLVYGNSLPIPPTSLTKRRSQVYGTVTTGSCVSIIQQFNYLKDTVYVVKCLGSEK